MISKMDSGEYYCEARNSVGHRRCPGKRMQVGKQGDTEKRRCASGVWLSGDRSTQGMDGGAE